MTFILRVPLNPAGARTPAPQDAKLIKWEQLWLRQVRWKKVAQDSRWDPSHPIPWGEPRGETQWSLWVASDTAELESYTGYSVSCSLGRQNSHTSLMKSPLTTSYLICTMKWLVVQRQQFHPAAKRWKFQEDKRAAIPSLLWERDQTNSEDGPQPIQECSPVSFRSALQWTNSCFVSTKLGIVYSKEAIRGPKTSWD